jgi:hypothetical protein
LILREAIPENLPDDKLLHHVNKPEVVKRIM